jgi:hypothetical protein
MRKRKRNEEVEGKELMSFDLFIPLEARGVCTAKTQG